MTLYLDTNIFFNLFYPTDHTDKVKWIFAQLSPEYPGITSQWTIAEMFRAVKKQVNLGELDDNDGKLIIEVFLSRILELYYLGIIKLVPVDFNLIIQTNDYIFHHNLFAADALHRLSAQKVNADALITFDKHFKPISNEIQVFNIYTQDWNEIQNLILKLHVNAGKE